MNERLKLETLGFADTGWDWEGRTFPGCRGSRVSQKRGSKWDLKTEISEIEWTLGEGTKKMGWVREAAMGDTLSSANLSDQGCSSGFGSSYTASSEGNAIVTHCVFGKERWIQHGRRTEENFLPFCRALTKTELRGISPLVHPIQDRQTHTHTEYQSPWRPPGWQAAENTLWDSRQWGWIPYPTLPRINQSPF